MFVRVKNCVTNNAIRPGAADGGTIKLKADAITIVIQGM